MSIHQVEFRPRVTIEHGDEGESHTLHFDWSDSCQGEFDEDGDCLGHTDACNGAEQWLEAVKEHFPVLTQYPNPQQENVWTKAIFNPAADPTFHPVGPFKIETFQPENAPDVAVDIEHLKRVQESLRLKRRNEPFVTCRYYTPPQEHMDDGNAPAKDWPFDKYFGYGACTNKAIVGPQGYGQCRYHGSSSMVKCQGYNAEEPEVLGTADGTVPVTISKKRVHMGAVRWEVTAGEDTTLYTTEDEARSTYIGLTGSEPVAPEKPEKVGTGFLGSLVGACREQN